MLFPTCMPSFFIGTLMIFKELLFLSIQVYESTANGIQNIILWKNSTKTFPQKKVIQVWNGMRVVALIEKWAFNLVILY